MKIQIQLEEDLDEDKVVIHCSSITEDIQKIQNAISNIIKTSRKMSFRKDEKEYFITLDDILFFETSNSFVSAHTKDDVYETSYKLYELENILPSCFIRVSKSSILNVNKVYAIHKNVTSSSVVSLADTHKQVYVSRLYYKELIKKMEEMRL